MINAEQMIFDGKKNQVRRSRRQTTGPGTAKETQAAVNAKGKAEALNSKPEPEAAQGVSGLFTAPKSYERSD